MSWITIDSADDLRRLDGLVCWEDSRVVEIYAKGGHEAFFPDDINRSGYSALNYYILCEGTSSAIDYLEIALIHCEWLSHSFLENPFFQGRVDSLLRIEVCDYQKFTLMRCARLMYRVHDPSVGVQPGYLARSFTPLGGPVR